MTVEYRVTWQREGRQRSTKIYQTADAAHRKARGILALEQVKDETSLHSMPDLAVSPTIETREVGLWERAMYQPQPPTDRERESMREYFPPRETARYGDSGDPNSDPDIPF